MNIGVEYILIAFVIVLTIMKSIVAYVRIRKAGGIVYEARNNPLSLMDALWIMLTIIVFGFIMMQVFGRSYMDVLYFIFYVLLTILLESKLMISKNGLYARIQYVLWSEIDQVVLENNSVIKVKRKSLFAPSFKIKNLSDQEKVLELIRKLHK